MFGYVIEGLVCGVNMVYLRRYVDDVVFVVVFKYFLNSLLGYKKIIFYV